MGFVTLIGRPTSLNRVVVWLLASVTVAKSPSS
jgi:hypothetical protein